MCHKTFRIPTERWVLLSQSHQGDHGTEHGYQSLTRMLQQREGRKTREARDHCAVGQPGAGGKTMMTKAVWGTLTALVCVLGLGGHAEAQLAKQGTYTSHFGWYAMGKTYELEKGHTLFQGEYSGTNFNDAGTGFRHPTSAGR